MYDLENKNVGIAQTVFNVSSSDTNVQEIRGSQLPGASSTATGSEVTQTASGSPNEPTEGLTTPSGLGSASSGTFDLGGSYTGSGSKPSHSKGAAAGLPIPAPSMYLGAGLFAITALSGLSGALMILL